ncbi:hypothetical protein HanRHA438_Chr17g0799051 [Helianthus annuus]|nr:hypothetical protein HanRHA438_Chr17g0799051 [Helianthus annuus]
MVNYRGVACNASHTTFDQRNKIGNRSAEVIVPRTLSLLLVKIMKSCSLNMASISTILATFHTFEKNQVSNKCTNLSNFTN